MNLGASMTHKVAIFRISPFIIGAMALEMKSVLTIA
jgi:hypothetical protein